LAWAFKTSHSGNWHPLTWLSHMADGALYGLNPGGHHLTNLLFHTANVLLLFLVLRQWTGALWRSALVAALFAWHPLHVESVAWVSERKDVLSAFFCLLALAAYGRYAQHQPNGRAIPTLQESHSASPHPLAPRGTSGARIPPRNSRIEPMNLGHARCSISLSSTSLWRRGLGRGGCFFHEGFMGRGSSFPRMGYYLLALFFFALALLSKPMVVTLPFVLLLLDFWPLRRPAAWGLLLEKIPFFVLAALDCVATLWAQRAANSVVSLGILPFSARIANALASYMLYLGKTIWPANLALPYPYSHVWTFWPAAGAGCLLLLMTAAAIFQARRQPWLLAGWLWFLGTLAPVIGLVQVGIQPMADRYTYLPLIGVFIMAAWSIPAAWTHWPRPGLVFGAVVAGALGFLLAGAEGQLQYWRNSVALFTHTVAVTRDNILAQYNLAEALARQGDEPDAIIHYQCALAITPNQVEAHYNCQTQAHYNLGLIYRSHQQWSQAADQFRACLRADPTLARARSNLDAVLAELAKDEARTTK
jgi:tetratricopeptide (TPR) repeat protein